MHSFLHRTNALATFAGTVLAGMCLLVTITDYFHPSNPVVSCAYLGVEGLQKEFGHDRAYIVLNASMDLRGEFSWNTKQLFVHADVEFATRRNARNQIVMWHAIIQNQADALLTLPSLRQAYPYAVTDQGFSLRGREFNVTVAWNVMPRVGALFSRSRTFGPFRLPDAYYQPAMGKLVRPGEEGRQGEQQAAGQQEQATTAHELPTEDVDEEQQEWAEGGDGEEQELAEGEEMEASVADDDGYDAEGEEPYESPQIEVELDYEAGGPDEDSEEAEEDGGREEL